MWYGLFRAMSGKRWSPNGKSYGVIFTCLTVRVVHLEIANSLTPDSAIMAIQWMDSTREIQQRFSASMVQIWEALMKNWSSHSKVSFKMKTILKVQAPTDEVSIVFLEVKNILNHWPLTDVSLEHEKWRNSDCSSIFIY